MAERDALIDPILLGASAMRGRLFRNNSGVAFHKDGSVVRYGVGQPGGSDVIGWMPWTVRPRDVGLTIAVFTAIEAKTGAQKPTEAQDRFLEIVRKAGGLGLWGNDPAKILDELKGLLGG